MIRFIFKNWIVPTASVLYKSSVLNSELYQQVLLSKVFIYGDTPLFVTCAELGKVRGMSDVMSVYRRNDGGVTMRRKTIEWVRKNFNHIIAFPKYFSINPYVAHYVATLHVLNSAHILSEANCSKREFLSQLRFLSVFSAHCRYYIVRFLKYLIKVLGFRENS